MLNSRPKNWNFNFFQCEQFFAKWLDIPIFFFFFYCSIDLRRMMIFRKRTHLRVNTSDFAPEYVHMSVFALGTTFFLAMYTERAITLFGTNAATLHRLAARRIRKFSGYFDVQLQKSLQRYVRWKRLYTLKIISGIDNFTKNNWRVPRSDDLFVLVRLLCTTEWETSRGIKKRTPRRKYFNAVQKWNESDFWGKVRVRFLRVSYVCICEIVTW